MKCNWKKYLLVLLIVSLLCGCIVSVPVSADTIPLSERTDILPFIVKSEDENPLATPFENGTEATLLTNEEADACGLPAGFTGTVLKTTSTYGNQGGNGVCLDFSALAIPVADIAEMTIRVLVPTEAREIRLYTEAASWVMRWVPLDTEYGTWVDITLTCNGDNFYSSNSFASLADENGNLGRFGLLTRSDSKDAGACFYVDGFTVKLRSEISEDVEADDKPGRDEIPYVDHIEGVAPYKYRTMNVYTAEEAADAGVPEGSTGYVMALRGTAELGFSVDFSEYHIPITTVKALVMRVYYNDNTKEVRITYDAGHHWSLRHLAEKPGEWEEVVLDSSTEIAKLANEDGELGAFGFGFRFYNEGNCYGYVDYIGVELLPADTVPPTITYEGETTLNLTEGHPFSVDATAYDAYEETDVPIQYVWSDGAVDENGLLKKGTHTCTLTATDSYGNASTVKLTVNVGERDTEAPVIGFDLKSVCTFAGVRADLAVPVTDNVDNVSLEIIWPDEALDENGCLLVGNHTVCLVATDLSGNRTEKMFTLRVAETPTWTDVIQDSKE